MQSIEVSWNISFKGCELVGFSLKTTLLQRWTCSATSSPTPPPLSMWSSSTNGWSPHSKWKSFLPSFLTLARALHVYWAVQCAGAQYSYISRTSMKIERDRHTSHVTLNIFYCPDLIFWTVWFGFRPLGPKRAIPHPITIQNMRFRRLEIFCGMKI